MNVPYQILFAKDTLSGARRPKSNFTCFVTLFTKEGRGHHIIALEDYQTPGNPIQTGGEVG